MLKLTSFLVIVFMCLFLVSSCSEISSELKEVSNTKILMGTQVSITVFDESNEYAILAIEKAFDQISKIEQMMSTYKNDSELMKLNAKKSIEASDELIFVIQKSLKYSEFSRGAFDISIDPILKMWDKVKTTQKFPDEKEVNETLKFVGWERIKIEGNQIAIDPDMSLNLGGIAKGYAIDQAIETLKKEGIKNALVNAGGDIRTIGSKGGLSWKIALQNPRDKNDFLAVIDSDDYSIVTSGDYERYFITEGKKVIHIADPRTGYSSQGVISATIVTKLDAINADALSTAVFVLGAEDGMKLIESLDDIEGMIITEDREVLQSSGFVW